MAFQFGQAVPPQRQTDILKIATFCLVLSLIVAIPAPVATLQAQNPPAKKAPSKVAATAPAEAILGARIKNAESAKRSKDPDAIDRANRHLSGLALREMAQLRLLELAYPQAIDLYRTSLELDDDPGTRVDLAIADLDALQVDDAITESTKVLAAAPDDVRANTILGRALMRQQKYPQAAEALSKAIQSSPDIESMYSLGICLLASSNPKDKERAAAVFRQMVEVAGDSGSIHVLFGRAYRDAGDLPTAIRELERAIRIDPKTPHAHYFLGLASLALNEWKPTPKAHDELMREADNYPRDFLANYMLGFLASSERQYDVADKYLKIAAEVNPTWPEPWLYMGLNAYAQGNMAGAEENLRKAVLYTGKDEARSNYQIRRAYVDLGRILSSSGRKEEAESFLAKAHDLQNKTMQETQQSVAQTAAAAGAGDSAALVALNSETEAQAAPLLAADTDPFAPLDAAMIARANLTPKQRSAADSQEARLRLILGESINDLATSEAIRGKFTEALAHYQQSEHWNSMHPGLARNLGMCAYKAANYSEAIRGLSQALTEKSDDVPVRALLGMSYFASDRFGEAVKTFAPLGTRGEQDPTVGYAWAASIAKLGDLKQASAVLIQFENANIPNETLVLVGQLWIEIGDYNHALDALHRALQSNPSVSKAHYFAGLAYLRSERWPEAATEFQAELALSPDDPDARYNLGFVFLQQAKIDDAMRLFQQVIGAQPNYANAQYQVGKIMLDQGQLPDAISHLEIAARLIPQVDYVHYQLQSAYRKQARTADADRELEIYKELKAKSRAQSTVPGQNP